MVRTVDSPPAAGRWLPFRRHSGPPREPVAPHPATGAAQEVTEPAPPDPASTEPTSAEPAAASSPGESDDHRRPLIFGRVTEDGADAVEGATLTLTDLSGRELGRDLADPRGHYQLRPSSGGSFLVICAAPAHQPTAALVAVTDAPVRHDVVLSGAGAGVSGVVSRSDTGQPLAGAMVTLVDLHGHVVGAVSTEPDGRYAFSGIAQGHYTLTVAATALQPVAEGIDVPHGGQLTHDVAVPTRVQLTGVVRSATTATPVPEALATLLTADGQVVASAVTDSTGGFVFDNLEAGAYTLVASGYPPVASEVNLDTGERAETVVTLRPPVVADATGDHGAPRGGERDMVDHGER